jgi:hypothetical protein
VQCIQVADAARVNSDSELALKLAEVACRLPRMAFPVNADGSGGSKRVSPLPTEVVGIA